MDSASMDFRAIAWERGWSLTSLADELGLTITQVSNRVHQVVPWRLPEAVRAADVLGMTLDEFAAFFQATGKGA